MNGTSRSIERRSGVLPVRVDEHTTVRRVARTAARAARAVAPVALPLATWLLERNRTAPTASLLRRRPTVAARGIEMRWTETTLLEPDASGRVRRRSFGSARIDIRA